MDFEKSETDEMKKKKMKIEVKKEANNGFDFVLKGGLVMSDDIDDLKKLMKTDFEVMKKALMDDAQPGFQIDTWSSISDWSSIQWLTKGCHTKPCRIFSSDDQTLVHHCTYTDIILLAAFENPS